MFNKGCALEGIRWEEDGVRETYDLRVYTTGIAAPDLSITVYYGSPGEDLYVWW